MSTQRASPASPSPPPPPRSPLKWLKSRRRSASPDSTCPICLSEVVNKSVTNTCMHEFCFCCLQEWSKIKAECPLCKQRFSKIYHTIKSMDVYEEHILETAGSSAGGIGILDPILINFQILTNARLRAPLMLLFPPREHSSRSSSRLSGVSGSNAPVPPESIVTRRRIYDQNLWALPLRSQRTAWRIRESSPEFYRMNPAQTHRLIPWLLRELHVLLGTATVDISALINAVMQAIQMYPIRSRHFASRMRTYLGENTAHFVHEFYRFAVAPFDMDLYDMCVEYTSFNNDLARSVETASDSDSDVEIVRVHTHLNTQRPSVPFSSSTSMNHHNSPNGRPSSGRLGRTSACPFFASSSQSLDRDVDSSPVSSLLATPSSPSLSSMTYYDSERVASQTLDDEGDISSVSTVLASPVLSSLNRSPEVIVIGSSPSYAGSASPSYSSDSDIQILSPPPRPTPIVITLDESSEEDSKVGVKTEQSSEPEPIESIPGPSTSGQVVEKYTTRAIKDSFSSSSSSGETYQPTKRKKKRKLKSTRRLPPKKRSKGWTTSDESETECSKQDSPIATRRMSKFTPKRKHRLVTSSSSSS